MQQIATSQKEIAAGALPIDINVETQPEGQAFQSVLQSATSAKPKANEQSMPATSKQPVDNQSQNRVYEQEVDEGVVSLDKAEMSNQKPDVEEAPMVPTKVSDKTEKADQSLTENEQVQAEIDEILGNNDVADIDWVSFVEAIDKQLAPESKKINDLAQDDVSFDSDIEQQEAQSKTEDTESAPVLFIESDEAVIDIPIEDAIIEAIQQPAEQVSEESKVIIASWSNKVAELLESEQTEGSKEQMNQGADALLLQGLVLNTVDQSSDPDAGETDLSEKDVADLLLDQAVTSEEVVAEDSGHIIFPIVVDNTEKEIKTEALTDKTVQPVNVEPLIVSDEVIMPLAEHVASVLDNAAQEKAAVKAISGELAAMIKEFTAQKSEGREPGISLKKAVAAAIDKGELSLTAEQQQAVAHQVSRAEQMVNVIKAVADSSPQPLHSVLGPQSSSTSEQQLFAAAERLTAEGSTQVSDQIKAAQTTQGQIDKPVPVHQPEGQKQVAEKIRWMVNSRTTAAEIRLDPPELGSMQIRVNMSGDTASVSFVVQSAQARDVLADATPRLRDMLAEQGIDLGESFVEQQDQQQQFEGDEGGSGGSPANFGVEEEEMTVVEQPINRPSVYNIDAYV
ncbi:flagellar hook-length control protein FliK [Alteromonas sediminis]|uniref:Flagellar hook-length control protein FliK n=1 Tax=Alteromonas sediminis TaxID=2259342 RepID=A0A3N5Y915_9ALTE|nr:flagellar hook-length control protein FliK [Alteromonas sediminis]RPJ65005.1 flagellar hook-length control protein FliK [Alteromonas sediminis]